MSHDRLNKEFSDKGRPKNRNLERKKPLREEIIVVKNKGALVGVKVGNKMIKFRPKSSWQKNDCISCQKDSHIEATYKDSAVRCCTDEDCMKRAAQMAVI